MNLFNTVICRYNEIATKGENRSMFENRLSENLRLSASHVCPVKMSKVRGRLYMRKTDKTAFTEEETEKLTARLKRCFGLETFSFCLESEPTKEAIFEMVKISAPYYFEPRFEPGKKLRFRTRARRSDKSFPLRSREIEIASATLMDELFGTDRIMVDLENPEISIGIEVRERNAIVYYETIHGAGGLPVGSNPPVLTLLSGGIDSPVACSMILKRGCRSDFLTFHSFPYTPKESVEKVARIAALVNRWQDASPGVLYACNISPVQKLIRDNCTEKYRTVLYRRMMMRIGAMICEKYGLLAIVTGESVGQVASQTVENMGVIDLAVETLILRPLCGMDKNETIRRAEALGTFTTSIEPMADSCTVFAPNSPSLHSKRHTVEWEESRIPDLENALRTVFESIEAVPLESLDL